MAKIKLKSSENDVKQIIRQFISKDVNPYEGFSDSRKIFEKIKPYQIGALKCLASYGIINIDFLSVGKVKIISKDLLTDYGQRFQPLSRREENAMHLLTSHFYQMSLFGNDGLKERTGLLESKYDA
jgi:hypothetical protein